MEESDVQKLKEAQENLEAARKERGEAEGKYNEMEKNFENAKQELENVKNDIAKAGVQKAINAISEAAKGKSEQGWTFADETELKDTAGKLIDELSKDPNTVNAKNAPMAYLLQKAVRAIMDLD